LVFLSVILLAEAVDFVVYVSANYIDEAVYTADGVISVFMVHVCNLLESAEHLVVAVASIEILVRVLYIPSSEVDLSGLNCDRSRIKRNFALHRNLLLFKSV